MQTSYFGRMNSAEFKGRQLNTVCIAASCRYYSGRRYSPLYPTWEMIKLTDEEVYREMYFEQILDKLNPLKVYRDLGEDAILLCHEKADDIMAGKTFCHRRMVAEWLEEALAAKGIEVYIPELRSTKDDLKSILKNTKYEQMKLF